MDKTYALLTIAEIGISSKIRDTLCLAIQIFERVKNDDSQWIWQNIDHYDDPEREKITRVARVWATEELKKKIVARLNSDPQFLSETIEKLFS